MDKGLEFRIKGLSGSPGYKSIGERRIASFFDSQGVKFQYEPGILVYPSAAQPRIWYPDFYLPEFAVYLEYFGMVGDDDYNKGIERKMDAYGKMDLDVIPFYPRFFSEDWQGYISKELGKITDRRYRSLATKLPRSYPSVSECSYRKISHSCSSYKPY